jgi:hypothetical protein
MQSKTSYGVIPEGLTNTILVLIPKGKKLETLA